MLNNKGGLPFLFFKFSNVIPHYKKLSRYCKWCNGVSATFELNSCLHRDSHFYFYQSNKPSWAKTLLTAWHENLFRFWLICLDINQECTICHVFPFCQVKYLMTSHLQFVFDLCLKCLKHSVKIRNKEKQDFGIKQSLEVTIMPNVRCCHCDLMN